jgi:hypothetical protein
LENTTKARLIEEQILHRLGYNVFTIPQLTEIERDRLVDGYLLFESRGQYEDPQEVQQKAEQLIKEREDVKHRNRR